jgi:predicted metal-dependent phosphoesterase TrpH
MRVDLHTHTLPASSCSHITHDAYVERCGALGVEAIALTNHGDVSDNRILQSRLADLGVVLVHGVEISTLYGDYVIFSPDLEYLATLRDVQRLPRPDEIPETAAIVWVHPAAGGGRSGSSYYRGLAETVGPFIDGVEVYNGTWSGSRYVETARAIAADFGLAATGGSDAHQTEDIGRCTTQMPWPIKSTADVVRALKERLTMPVTEARQRRGWGRLFGG